MLEHIPSSIKVTISHAEGEVDITAPRHGGDFRNQLLSGFLKKDLLEALTLSVNGIKFDVPYTNDGMPVQDFFRHISVCVDLYQSFYQEEKS